MEPDPKTYDRSGDESELKKKPAHRARPLDPDLLPWEKQPGETDAAYAGFLTYRDMEKRGINRITNGPLWSMIWQWPYRCLEWDRHVARQDAEELIRYRVEMNARHRAVSRLAISRVAQWLQSMTEAKIAAMRPSDVSRMLEVAARLEREAAGAHLPEVVAQGVAQDANVAQDVEDQRTLGEILETDPLREQKLARVLNEILAGH